MILTHGLTYIFLLLSLFICNNSHAEVLFFWGAELQSIGNYIPNPPLCQSECGGSGELATCQSSGGAPEGSKYWQWRVSANQAEAYTVINNGIYGFPFIGIMGKTIYLAYYFNFTRIDGVDIWHEQGQSADKGVEIKGDGLRRMISRGHWDNLSNNSEHRYTVWGGAPDCPYGPDTLPPNVPPYSETNPIQLEYGQWYSAVMAVKISNSNTGSFTVWINGLKIIEYLNIQTVNSSDPTITSLKLCGTIAQPAYDAPAHYRKFDALMLADDLQDIVDGGYLVSQPTAQIAPPNNLRIVD